MDFKIISKDFKSKEYGINSYLWNWPMVYILENGKQAYIGESLRVAKRMREHKAKKEKDMLSTAHFIYSGEFNQSVTFDYESRLIQHFVADGKFKLLNENGGIAHKSYYNKRYYDKNFRDLWEALRKKELVTHTLDEIENMDMFKYSPYKELNDDQRKVIDGIVETVKTDISQAVLVGGAPGTGKTITAVFLFKMMRDHRDFKDKKIGLVIPQTSLRATLKKLFGQIDGLRASDVLGPSDVTKKSYDILLVDEAHRLHQRKNIPNMGNHDQNNERLGLTKDASELDWVLKQAAFPVLFYDRKQVVNPSGIHEKLLKQKIREYFTGKKIKSYTLLTQMRVKGGEAYIDYVYDILHDVPCVKKTMEEYDFKLVDRFADFQRLLSEKEEAYHLCRMLAGYAWPWLTKKKDSEAQFDICIEGISKKWNNRTVNWVHSEGAVDEVGCIHSIQGYDLNYGFVIIGNDLSYNPVERKIVVNRGGYYDKNGKATASEKELSEYIRNIYYVLMTRGIKGTYVYVCDSKLKKYLSQYMDVI